METATTLDLNGLSGPIVSLVKTLQDQNIQKRDIVNQGASLNYRHGKIWVQGDGSNGPLFRGYTPTDICHGQIAEKLGIPMKYYDRMLREYPDLLEYNVNSWFAKDQRIKYMLRTFDGGANQEINVARALLSNGFQCLDNYDVLFHALKAIQDMGVNIKVIKAEVTARRMYLHIICPDVQIEAESFLKNYLKDNDAVGNFITAGMIISNSEVGEGAYEICPRGVEVKCNNGLLDRDAAFRKIHLGAKHEVGIIEWSQKTKDKMYELVMSQTTDAVKTFLSTDYLGKMIKRVEEAHKQELEYPLDTMQHVCKELQIADDEKRSILKYFMQDGDTKASGIFQAITRKAGDMDPDAQYLLEANAFKILPKIKKFDRPFSGN